MSEFGQLPGQQFYLELTINGERYNPKNLQYFVIREWIFNILPTIEFQIVDEGFMNETAPLEDACDIEIVLGKNEDDENPIEMVFTLDDYNIGIIGDNRKAVVSISGHLKVDGIFDILSRSFAGKNSVSILRQIASESGLSFSNPRNVVTSDNMNWLQVYMDNYDFIRHVLRRANIPNDALFFYANHSNEFVLTSLVTEIEKKEFKRAKFDIENYNSFALSDEDIDTIWFGSYNQVNYSGYFNKKVGYGFGYSYYDLDGSVVSKKFDRIKKFTDLSFRNKNNVGSVSHYNDYVQDYVSRNLYSDKYFESLSRNEYLIANFFANSVILSINSLNQVNLMDTLDVDIPSMLEEEESNPTMSGPYLVAGIQHEVSNGGTYVKKIALGRNGMNKSPNVNFYEVEE